MSDRQTQRGGDNAQQIQVAGDLVIGVSEARAAEIAVEQARHVAGEYALEAQGEAFRRMDRLNEAMVERLARVESLPVLADPAFAFDLRRAQVSAASTERESDYDMLAELLTDRAIRGGNRTVRAGLRRATEIVDQIDDDALLGLTLMQAVIAYVPKAGEPDDGLAALDALYSDLIADDPLPTGGEWLDHLDILDAVRVSQPGSLRTFVDVLSANLVPGYVCPGIESGSEDERRLTDEARDLGIALPLVPHALIDGRLRLSGTNVARFENLLREDLTERARAFALRVARDHVRLDEVDPGAVDSLRDLLRRYETLLRVQEWWDAVPNALTISAAGRVLARANAKRRDVRGVLPDLD